MMMADTYDDLMAKVTVTAFVEEDIKEGLKALADVERRSMSQMMAVLIENAVEEARKQGRISAEQQTGKN
jgi:predicted transcriptional regulator